MLVWPLELPKPNREGWQRSLQDPRSDRMSSAGPTLPRLMHSVRIKNVTLVMDFTRSELAVFDRFLEHDTMLGSLPFLMPDPTTDGWPALLPDGKPILLPDGRPVLMACRRRCYFGKPMPSEAIIGVGFRLAFPLVVLL